MAAPKNPARERSTRIGARRALDLRCDRAAALRILPRMERRTLAADRIAPEAAANTAKLHPDVVDQVIAAIERDKFVVVGMAQNPVVKRARKLLDEQGIKYTYLEYGSYLSEWKRRLAIKLWAGFPTFPMVFIDGKLVGGAAELKALADKGALKS